MRSLFKQVMNTLVGDTASSAPALTMPTNWRQSKKPTQRELIQLESEIGSQLFGPVAKGRKRAFFCLDKDTWIWHESWRDEKGTHQQVTVRYELHDKGVLKVLEGPRYEFIEGQELRNFDAAIQMYYQRVAREIYHVDPATGYRLAI